MSVLGYGLEPFGMGPYGGLGGVMLPAMVPPLGGYGGYAYGYSSYGSLGSFGSPAIGTTSGFGGCGYGINSYGCIGMLAMPPMVISAVSITGFIIEVFFSNEMSPDADLFDPASYTLTDLAGAAPATVLSVQSGVPGVWGPTSVLLHHTGTTLGGLYRVTVVGPRDISGVPIAAYAPLNEADCLCKGEPPPFTITPTSGTDLLYEFEQDMLPESGFTPGILQTDAYDYETAYPQNLIPIAVNHQGHNRPIKNCGYHRIPRDILTPITRKNLAHLQGGQGIKIQDQRFLQRDILVTHGAAPQVAFI